MQFRAIRKEETAELMALQSRSFFYTYDRSEFAAKVERDEEYWNTGRAAFDDNGRIMAGLDLSPFRVWFDGQSVGMGGIGLVASSVEERRSGNVRRLLEAVFTEMHDRGDVFSYLFPFSTPYYRKFGYEVSLTTRTIKAPLQPLLTQGRPGRAEQFIYGGQGGESAAFEDIYTAFASKHNLALDRSAYHWRKLLDHDHAKERHYTYLWHDETGRPCAYAILTVNGDWLQDINVNEAAWTDENALLGLLGFLGRFHGNAKRLVWTVPGSFMPELYWEEPKDLEIEYKYYGMNRIINVPEALRLLCKPDGTGSVQVAVHDAFFQRNSGIYRVDWEDGRGDVSLCSGAEADLECSVEALAQMIVGYLGFEDAIHRQDVAVHSKAGQLGRLFVKKPLYLADHF